MKTDQQNLRNKSEKVTFIFKNIKVNTNERLFEDKKVPSNELLKIN